ncbi:g8673 [Coccomyxa viridis]|uniref:G8673 protein n=1 Tax=Coccomyxa viridis TaxID=1274662 RepID=A0ABP1G3L2_9CHLO
MAQTGLSAIAASLNRERGLSRGVLGGMAGCVRQPLGVRVPCGQQHAMGRNVPDAMARASVYGIRKIKYCAQGLMESERWSCEVRSLGGAREEAFVHICKGTMLDVPSADNASRITL